MTKEEELCALLDAVFANGHDRPDFAAIRELAYLSKHSSWLITELLKVLWTNAEAPEAFDDLVVSYTYEEKPNT